jgi:hypothetical protein
MSVATSTAIGLAVAAGTAGSSIYAANRSSGAAKEAAKDQTSAANYAADAQSKSNAAALDFQKQQAAADQAKYEASQRANYAQYLTHYNAVKGLGGQLGVDLPDAPSYDAALGGGGAPSGAPPASTTPGAPTASGATGPGLTPPGGGPVLSGATAPPAYTGAPTDRAAITAWVSSLAALPGADPSLTKDPGYWAGRILDTGGLTGANTDYWVKASTGPTAFVNNPNREGGAAGAGGGSLPMGINAYLPSGTPQAPALVRPAAFRLGSGS